LLRLLAAADMQLSIEWQAFVSSVQAAAANKTSCCRFCLDPELPMMRSILLMYDQA